MQQINVSMLLVALVPALILVGLGIGRLPRLDPGDLLQVLSLGLGAALLVLVAGTVLFTSWRALHHSVGLALPILLALATYLAVFIRAGWSGQVGGSLLVLLGLLGLLPLWVLGGYSWLLTGCSLGHCL